MKANIHAKELPRSRWRTKRSPQDVPQVTAWAANALVGDDPFGKLVK